MDLKATRDATPDPVASWVADNLAVVNNALAARGDLSGSMLLRWHQRLMHSQTTIDSCHRVQVTSVLRPKIISDELLQSEALCS